MLINFLINLANIVIVIQELFPLILKEMLTRAVV